MNAFTAPGLDALARAERDVGRVSLPADAHTQAIIDAVPDAIIGIDRAGCITLVNPAAISVFGNDPLKAGHAAMPLTDWLPELSLAGIAQTMEAGLPQAERGLSVARFEALARRHDGTEFTADVSLSRVDNPHGASYTCVVRDITEQLEAFALLTLYRRALDCTSNGVVISDLRLPERPVRYANLAFTRITGFGQHEALGRNLDFLAAADPAQPGLARLADSVVQGEPDTAVLRHRHKDGTPFLNEMSVAPIFSPDGDIDHSVSVLQDVTERERSRLALAERNARLNAVFDLSPDGFLVFDTGRRLVSSNRAFLAMTGWPAADEAAPMSLAEFDRRFARLCDPACPVRPLAEALRAADGATDTLTLLQPEHRVLARSVRGQADGQGETIVFLRDVTRETEVDRMKSEFLTTAAHELRTPMVSVFGFTELLLSRPVPEARRRDMLETIHRQSQRLINMVNDLLDLARIEARQGKDLKRGPCRLGDLVGQTVAPYAELPGPARLCVRMAHADAALHVDAEKTIRVLTNVISNAFKYSPAGGDIVLTTLDGRLRDGPAVGVRISDPGIGMSPAQCERVFERFYRADPSGNIPGTGLGMSLVKEITELHGGRVEVRSALGSGTEVTLWWPLASGEPGEPAVQGW
jgi:PAS domain S-box-containing protein